jgi:uncharacterized protein YjbI with pentapeptide repeats
VSDDQQRADFEARIERHRIWLETEGAGGERFDLRAAGLADVDWSGLNICEVDLRDAILEGAKLRGADLFGVLFAGVKLDGADVSGANLAKANFDESSLVGTVLHDAKVMRTTFAHADLRRADFSGADLLKVFFYETDLRGAILAGSLDRTSFIGARVHGATLRGATNIDTMRADWIDIGENEPERLDGAAALDWLRDRAR